MIDENNEYGFSDGKVRLYFVDSRILLQKCFDYNYYDFLDSWDFYYYDNNKLRKIIRDGINYMEEGLLVYTNLIWDGQDVKEKEIEDVFTTLLQELDKVKNSKLISEVCTFYQDSTTLDKLTAFKLCEDGELYFESTDKAQTLFNRIFRFIKINKIKQLLDK
jgi:hypothetical protein